jgi:predicted transcriptional regulator
MPSSDKTVADLDLNDEHITAGLDDSLQEAAKRLLTVPGGILVILDDDSKVKGVIGHKQILSAIVKGVEPSNAKCSDYMEIDFMEIKYNQNLSEVLKQIKQRTPQAVVSVDDNGEFSGYFSPSDYLESKSLVKSLKSLKL